MRRQKAWYMAPAGPPLFSTGLYCGATTTRRPQGSFGSGEGRLTQRFACRGGGLKPFFHLMRWLLSERQQWGISRNMAFSQLHLLNNGARHSSRQANHSRSFSIMDRYHRARGQANSDASVLPHLPAATTKGKILHEILHPTALIRRPSDSPTPPSPRRPVLGAPIPADAKFSIWKPPVQPANPKSLTIALLGSPNAGKSSLMNAFLGVTVSAVSNKVNTTRTAFRGILTKDSCQLVFVDAPGIIESHPKKTFSRELVNAAWRGYEDADVGILIVDAVKRPTQQIFNVVRAIAPKPSLARFGFHHSDGSQPEHSSALSCSPSLDEMREAGIPGTWRYRLAQAEEPNEFGGCGCRIPIILCLNKIDLSSHPKWIYSRTREFESHGCFQRVFHVSAKNRRGTDLLLSYLLSEAVPRPWSFPPEMRTTLSKVQQVEELIRTYLFCWFNKDVPYRVRQQTAGWAVQEDGSVTIEQELIVKSAQVAKMICGVRGRILVQMRKNVTYKLEQLWRHKVVLHIHVKVSPG